MGSKVDVSIHGTTFFIPIITRTFFKRKECRREFLLFWSKSSSSNLGELLLPIIFGPIDFDSDSDDEILAIVSRIQGEPFHETRLEDEDSSAYKKAIHRLAMRLKVIYDSVEEKAEVADPPPLTVPVTVETADDSEPPESGPGFLDLIFETETLMPHWLESIDQLSVDLNAIGAAMTDSTAVMQGHSQTATAASKILTIRQVAEALDEPTAQFLRTANRYKQLSVQIGEGIAAIAQMATLSDDQADVDEAHKLADIIAGTHRTLANSLEVSGVLLSSSRKMGRMSRDMREPTKRITDAMRSVEDTLSFYDDWVKTLRAVENKPEEAE